MLPYIRQMNRVNSRSDFLSRWQHHKYRPGIIIIIIISIIIIHWIPICISITSSTLKQCTGISYASVKLR